MERDPRISLHRRFFRLTFLNILANVSVPLAGLVDTAMLGHLDDIRFLAGVALASVIFDLLYWSFGFLRMGTTGVTAQALGRGDTAEVHLTLYRGVAFGVAAGVVLWVLQSPLEELGFHLLSGEAGVEAAGRAYFGARIWAAPATLVNFAFLGWFLGREESGRALALTLTAALSNVGFNYLLIVRLGWAAYGAGVATALSQVLMLSLSLALFLGRPGRVPWRWPAVLDRERLAAFFRLNRDILVRTLCLVGAFAVFTNLSSLLGTEILAANAILLRIQNLAAYLIDGAAFATESLVGIFRGADRPRDLRRVVRLALITGMAFALVFLAGLTVVPTFVLGLLTSHGDVVAIGRSFAVWLWPVLVLGAVAFIYDGLFLGLTAGRALRNTMLLSSMGVFLPLATAGVMRGSNHLLWLSMAAFMMARAATLGWVAHTGGLLPLGSPSR
jgi:MATE family multidrug resistance protein